MNANGEPISAASLALLLQSHREFLSFLERRVGSREGAEELLQEAFLRGIERGGAIRDGESAVAWFYRVLRNSLIDRARRASTASRALLRLADEVAGPVDEVLQGEMCACFAPLLDTLKPAYAQILRAIDLGDGSLIDFARGAGITPNNAGVRLHRARAALERQLRSSCGTCADHGCLDCHCRDSRTPRSEPV